MLLKKLRIYERVVNKSDKFYPIQEQQPYNGVGTGDRGWRGQVGYGDRKLPADSFDYQLNTTLSGPELADKLERIAHFLKGEQKNVTIRLSIEAAEAHAEEQE
ncbi:hypothetical protein D3C78_1459740 [compost metagenome]